ncbi:MAG TPA: nitroreductase [Steroidobacteraceae bacterium]|jgi:nitroreductase|nr:nitroreductase [Steroidobacteraceae bacterium]
MDPEAHPLALETLLSRRSVPALLLGEPGPSPAQIDTALEAAARAPDHGALRPWRFVLIRAAAARARLSELFVRRMLERDAGTPPNKLDKARNMPLTAPLVIAIAAHVQREHKVPELEQLLSTGAAVMNLLNAFHAQGYGAIWLTGGNAYDPQIWAELGFGPEERSLGFLYVGTLRGALREGSRRPEPGAIAREWGG